MKALVLEDVEKLAVRDVPDPQVSPREVLIRVWAVGLCGTDLHLYHGHGNYRFDSNGRPIPLTAQPQILGHEFCGVVVATGNEARDLKPGDQVLCDQGRNCISQGRAELCPFCASGDSHQCEFYQEHGITGPPGALAEFIAMPAVNCIKIPAGMPDEAAALVEPVGCILHASNRAERATARFTFEGPERIRNVLICGGGPAGLLFLQYLRNVRQFDGTILVSDLRPMNLDLAASLGAIPVNVREQSLVECVRDLTSGERVHYLIDACGHGSVLAQIPGLLRKQGTLLLYGHGHKGYDVSLLGPILFLEPTLVAAVGASGGFDSDGRPSTYRRALELVATGQVKVAPFVTHRYHSLDDLPTAFGRDFSREDYVKGVLKLA
ncbi:MAG: zinc-dependent alcohol dehydrogenase [Terriglobia bacterium]